jgi:D-lactate dehydrogenase
MKIAIFNAKSFEIPFLQAANEHLNYQLDFYETRLTSQTAALAAGYTIISCFVNDELADPTLRILAQQGVKMIALRCAGFNQVDILAAKNYGISITRVPAYSPHAVAEFAVGLILSLNRKIHRAYWHVREHNFSLNGLLGFDLYQRTVGIIGTGNIGSVFARIMQGFGCKLLAFDPIPDIECKQLGVRYVKSLAELYQAADIISLHCPLNKQTQHLIGEAAIAQMRPGVMLINTSRGGLLDTKAVIQGLKTNKIGYLGIDVYEEEDKLFFADHSDAILQDDVFARLGTFPNVIITGHQAFFTREAITNIAQTTLANIKAFAGDEIINRVV